MKKEEQKLILEENEILKEEIMRLQANESICQEMIQRCEQLEDQLREAILEARKAQGMYNTLYKELLKYKK